RYAIVFLIGTLFLAGLAWILSGDPIRALSVLVIATPCPLILAVPVAIVSGLSRAARAGVLVKGGKSLEIMARIRTIVLDKTGTLTGGAARLVATHVAPGTDPHEALRLAASLDQASAHVIAKALVKEAQERGLALSPPSHVEESPGQGLTGNVDGHAVIVGGPAYVRSRLGDAGVVAIKGEPPPGAVVLAVAADGKLAAVVWPAGTLLVVIRHIVDTL